VLLGQQESSPPIVLLAYRMVARQQRRTIPRPIAELVVALERESA
jgi:hypothetical protein